MNKFEKLFESRKILVGLVVLFFVVSTVQGIFLVKLYHLFDQDVSGNTTRKFENNLGIEEDILKRFDQQSWDPFEELQSMRERMDRMFDDSYNRFRRSPFFDEERIDSLLPQTDLLEEDDRYVVKMNIPGSEQAEIKVDIEGANLTVKAQTQRSEDQKKDDGILRIERSTGAFQRTIQLPAPVDASTMKTEYKDGVLTVVLPKKK
jgi:HSP20 family protein